MSHSPKKSALIPVHRYGQYGLQNLIPYLMIATRLAITCVLLLDAADGATSWWFVTAISTAVLMDIADGVVARRLHVVTHRLRQADSLADFLMIVVVISAAWLTHHSAIAPFLDMALALMAVHFVSLILAALRYQQIPSYHTYSTRFPVDCCS
jgi:CDP-diacylglycerol---glycerol-3-phosphate 3-phosphatidyltransferase